MNEIEHLIMFKRYLYFLFHELISFAHFSAELLVFSYEFLPLSPLVI